MANDGSVVLNVQRFVAALDEAEKNIVAKERTLSNELEMLRSELKRIRGARSCLTKSAKAPRERKRNAPTKDDVGAIVKAILHECGQLPEEDLRCAVEKKLAHLGKSKQGFSLRFREVLRQKEIVRTNAGIQLVSEERK